MLETPGSRRTLGLIEVLGEDWMGRAKQEKCCLPENNMKGSGPTF